MRNSNSNNKIMTTILVFVIITLIIICMCVYIYIYIYIMNNSEHLRLTRRVDADTDRGGENMSWHFREDKSRLTGVPKTSLSKNVKFAVTPVVPTPSVPII